MSSRDNADRTSSASDASRIPGRAAANQPGFCVIGGPSVAFTIGGARFVSDPTFDPPTDYGLLQKTEGPAVAAPAVGDVDAVLVSHDDHKDNLDDAGRDFALAAPLILTTAAASERLGPPAQELVPWKSVTVAGHVEVTAVPARHGPADGERDARGFVNCEVIGFVLRAPEGTLYITGDNTSLEHVAEVRERFGRIDYAIVHAGRASVPARFTGRPLSLNADLAAGAAEVLGARQAIVVHQTGWAHFTEGPDQTRRAFTDAGLLGILDQTPMGHWGTWR